MRIRAHGVIAHMRQQLIGTLALFLVLTGGVAYAADTIGSSDIIDESILSQDIKNNEVKTSDLAANSVQTGKIGNDQVFSEDVRDDTLANGGLTAADLANNSVGASELQGARIFDSQDGSINDAVGGGAAEEILLTAQNYQVIARCLENPAGTVKANVVVKSAGLPATTAVDSNAPNGVNNVTNLAHGAEATLVSVGPTTSTNWQTGQYAVTSFNNDSGIGITGFNGNVAAATKFSGSGNADCRFQATALGGG
jgi:hypothetical protein